MDGFANWAGFCGLMTGIALVGFAISHIRRPVIRRLLSAIGAMLPIIVVLLLPVLSPRDDANLAVALIIVVPINLLWAVAFALGYAAGALSRWGPKG